MAATDAARVLLRAALMAVLVMISSSADAPLARAHSADVVAPLPPGPGAHGRAWPVDGRAGTARPRVERGWEPPPTPWAAGHRGVDLSARKGQRVRAVADGRVSFSGKVAGRGVLAIELSGTGDPPVRTTYEPVRPSVRKGERVRTGQFVATVTGRSSHCRGTCLHWGARRSARYLDPLSLLPAGLLRGGPSRLLPVFGVPVPKGQGDAGSEGDERARPQRQKATVTSGTAATVGTGAGAAEGTATGKASIATSATHTGGGATAVTLALAGGALLARRRLVRTAGVTPSTAPP